MNIDTEARDANSLLVELDRGLQSNNINDQCDTVKRFNTLLSYPMPHLVDSAFLKLAEAFRVGSNQIRTHICEVFQNNQQHLVKVHSIDDLYRSLFAVTTSNDPIARSIALLALGHIAPIVSDYKGVHHCISSSLDTSVEFELTATISCAASYVKYSAEFACNIYPRVVSILDSNKYPISTKIRALAVLDHKFYNANDAMTVRNFLIEVIERTNLKKLICACLTLSTKISYNSLSHIIAQIELLLRIFENGANQIIKACALKNLTFLAEKRPHVWESTHVDPLVSYLEREIGKAQPQDSSVSSVLSIFCKLLTCKCNFISQHEKNRIFALCYKFALSNSDLSLCSMAFQLLTVNSEESQNTSEDGPAGSPVKDGDQETLDAMKAFLIQSVPKQISSKSKSNHEYCVVQQVASDDIRLKSIYRHIVELVNLRPQYRQDIIRLLFERISSKDMNLSDLSSYYTELMCAIAQSSTDHDITPENCSKLINSRHKDLSDINLLNLFVLYFQSMRLKSCKLMTNDFSLMKCFQGNRSLSLAYKVMRQAMRYGQFRIASQLCQYLHEHVTTDTMDFYLRSLDHVCQAESLLVTGSDFDKNLDAALPLYESSVSPLRASVGVSKTTRFQLEYVWLRIRMLQVHKDLRLCCKIFEVLPITNATLLSAIGATRGTRADYGTNLSTINQMLKISKDFRILAECYESLSSTSDDSDHRTLDFIYLLKSSCIIMADVIDAVFQYGKNLHVISKLSLTTDKDLALEHRDLESACHNLIILLQNEIIRPGIFPSQKLIQSYILLFKTFSDSILSCLFSFPRRFFQINKQSPSGITFG